jgi:hypothetical protein
LIEKFQLSSNQILQMRIALLLLLSVFIFGLSFGQTRGQNIPVGQWRDHLPFSNLTSLARSTDRVWAASPYGLFWLDTEDNSINKLTKVNGLSDVGISRIAWNEQLGILLVAYKNANLDIIKGSTIINLPDIKNKQLSGDKSINNICFRNQFAYLSCDFGIVVVDLQRVEIGDTWYIGNQGNALRVFDLTFDKTGQNIYAATEQGLRKAAAASNLALFSSWTQAGAFSNEKGSFNLVEAFNDKIVTNLKAVQYNQDTLYVLENGKWSVLMKGTYFPRFSLTASAGKLIVNMGFYITLLNPDNTYNSQVNDYNPGAMRATDMIIDPDGTKWITDAQFGLIRINPDGISNKIAPNGPATASTFVLVASGKDIWGVAGGRNDAFGNLYNKANAFRFSEGSWTSFYNITTSPLGEIRDYVTLAIDPLNPKHLFAGSWGWGISEYLDGVLKNQFTDANSSLRAAAAWNVWIGIGGLAFDSKANLWASNSITPNLLSIKKVDGTWRSFNLSPYNTIDVGQLLIDQSDQKWIVLRNNGLLVFNDNHTIDNPADDRVKNLTNRVGNGNLSGSKVTSLAMDHDGLIWIGSDQGVSVIYNPGDIFTGSSFDAQTVRVVSEGKLIPLLESENITAIAVDGANRKWFGTANSGVFLISADGSKQILHFTADNSPLLSNTITCIGINGEGEVFFGTDQGLVSYRGSASDPETSSSGAYAFPNPVRPNYNGVIAIKGLTMNADVRITDVTGHLVYQTKAEGGQAIWSGNDLKGKRVVTGVYLVFITNSDGTNTAVTKILIVR